MSKICITLSTLDPAAVTMLKYFKEMGFSETARTGILCRDNLLLMPIERLIVPEEEYQTPKEPDPYPVDYDILAKELDISYYVVASRHWSISGQPSLTVHATGNFGKAIFGGRNRELQYIVPNPMRNVFMALQEDPPLGFQVSLEATHHSPTQFETPMFFAEVGSSLTQWVDEDVCGYLVKSILKGIESTEKAKIAIGFGGGHYCPKFSVMEREHAFGHIAAKYALPELTEELVGQMIVKTKGKIEKAFIEDGVKGVDRRKVESILNELELELERI
jgi:D-aminoacyl-tRNA deacylase